MRYVDGKPQRSIEDQFHEIRSDLERLKVTSNAGSTALVGWWLSPTKKIILSPLLDVAVAIIPAVTTLVPCSESVLKLGLDATLSTGHLAYSVGTKVGIFAYDDDNQNGRDCSNHPMEQSNMKPRDNNGFNDRRDDEQHKEESSQILCKTGVSSRIIDLKSNCDTGTTTISTPNSLQESPRDTDGPCMNQEMSSVVTAASNDPIESPINHGQSDVENDFIPSQQSGSTPTPTQPRHIIIPDLDGDYDNADNSENKKQSTASIHKSTLTAPMRQQQNPTFEGENFDSKVSGCLRKPAVSTNTSSKERSTPTSSINNSKTIASDNVVFRSQPMKRKRLIPSLEHEKDRDIFPGHFSTSTDTMTNVLIGFGSITFWLLWTILVQIPMKMLFLISVGSIMGIALSILWTYLADDYCIYLHHENRSNPPGMF